MKRGERGTMNEVSRNNGRGDFSRLLPARPREPPLVMHRCGRSLLTNSQTKFFRFYSTVPTLPAVEPATPLSKPNALTLIHKTSSLLPSLLPPAPRHPVESLKLWTDLLDYAHNAFTARKDSMNGGNRKARIVGAFIP